MKTIEIKGKSYTGVQPTGMSDAQFKSMLVRNDMTTEKIKQALKALSK